MPLFAMRRLLHAAACSMIAAGAAVGWAPAADAASRLRMVGPVRLLANVNPVFDAAGRVVMRDGGLVWVEEPTGIVPKLSDGGAAPGFPAGTLIHRLEFGSPVVQMGPPVIVAELQGGGKAVYLDEPGVGLRLASSTGKTVDPIAGIEVGSIGAAWTPRGSLPVANEVGDVLMYGFLRGGSLGAGSAAAWIERPGGSQIVFHGNTTMPGVGTKFGDFTMQELAFEDTGRVAVVHAFAGGRGLWAFDAPGLAGGRLVARSDSARHGIGFENIIEVHMANWRLVFHGDHSAIFSETNGVPELVAGIGRPAPGFGPGANYSEFYPESTAMNRHGDLAFVGVVADPTLPGGFASALWIDAIDRPVEFALNLSELLGTTLSGSLLPAAQKVAMNESGQVAFLGTGSEEGLWLYDPATGPQRIAAVGQQILVDLGDGLVMKTISSLSVGGPDIAGRSRASYLSDEGEVVFLASFTDNSGGVVVWSPVPEPASLILAAWLAVAVARRRAPRASCQC